MEWDRMETVIGEEMIPAPAPRTPLRKSGSTATETKKLPEYAIVSASKVQKELFKPEKGVRPLPQLVKQILLATAAPETPSGKGARPKLVEMLCHVDRMYVRIRRELFKTINAYKYLKLGTCPVNQGTKDHYYFLYLLKTQCGFKRESKPDYLSISNVLRFVPTTLVLREMPFQVPLQCKYQRYFFSYKVGFLPKLQGGTVYKVLQPKTSGNELSGGKTYTLGQPMYFEAKRPGGTEAPPDQRLYINKCFMTTSQDPNSTPKYTVLDNQGCMIDGKVTQLSKFLPGSSKITQKFSVGAFVFKDVLSQSPSQQLYLHCEISLGQLTATSSSKACNYDQATKKWKELYGDDSVCTCCESSCSSGQPKASRNVVSSHSWKVNFRDEDEYMELEPQIKSLDADMNLENPDLADHEDFLNYWENDYY
ncbi:zona pellucida sperm-binding protein 3 [Aulostomus maculatus]